MRASLAGSAKVILGSATPSVADTYIAQQSNRPILQLTKPARGQSIKPDIKLVSFANQGEFGRHRFLSRTLLASMEKNLADGTQTLIFHNRRGSAPLTICEQCGWMAACDNCQLPLTLHTDQHKLICHVCGRHHNIPPSCPNCGQPDIIHKGIGTKLIVSELERILPKTRIARFDTDTKSTERLHHQYQDLYDGRIPIIVGTQMVAKGLDVPNVTLVGVVLADIGMYLPDFRASVRALRDDYGGSFERFWEDFRGRPAFTKDSDHNLLNDWCMAACYSADPDGTVRLPYDPSTGRLIPEVWERWLALDPVRMVPDHAESLRSMRGIYIDAGKRDEWFLDLGAEAYRQALEGIGVTDVSFELFDAGHGGIEYRYPLGLRYLAERLG
jgi:hypothetical protein